jgi:hypothetical protein
LPTAEDALKLARQWLGNLEEERTKLADDREDVLQQRTNLRLASDALLRTRVDLGNAEAAYMTALRQHHARSNIALPPELEKQYQAVQDLRDTIGTKEDDYFQNERSFGALEWKFMDKEKVFYWHKLSDSFEEQVVRVIGQTHSSENLPSQSTASQLVAVLPNVLQTPNPISVLAKVAVDSHSLYQEILFAVDHLGRLKAEFERLKKEKEEHMEDHRLRTRAHWSTPPDVQRSLDDFDERASNVIDQMMKADAKLRRLKQQVQMDGHILNMEQSTSNLSGSRDEPGQQGWPGTSQAQSERAVAALVDDFSDIRRRIGLWILESLNGSSLELSRFKTRLGGLIDRNFDNESWWQILSHWNDDVTTSLVNHGQVDNPSASQQTVKAIAGARSPAKEQEKEEEEEEVEEEELKIPEYDHLPDDGSEEWIPVWVQDQSIASSTDPRVPADPIAEAPDSGNPRYLVDSAISLPTLPPKDSCQPSPMMIPSSLTEPQAPRTRGVTTSAHDQRPIPPAYPVHIRPLVEDLSTSRRGLSQRENTQVERSSEHQTQPHMRLRGIPAHQDRLDSSKIPANLMLRYVANIP